MCHGELLPEANKLYSGRMSAIGNMIGFLLGILATTINWNLQNKKNLQIPEQKVHVSSRFSPWIRKKLIRF